MNFKMPQYAAVCLFQMEVNIQILLYSKVALKHQLEPALQFTLP